MIEVEIPPLEPWQKDVVSFYMENANERKIVIKSVRQCGKSVLAQMLLIIASLQTEGSVSLLVSPVLTQSKKIYEEITSTCKQLIKKANSASLEITFINDSKILFKSGEQQDTIRGLTCKKGGILVLDEAAYIDDNLFYSILLPTTNVYKNDIFLFSTPKFQQGFFYDMFTQGETESNKCKSFDWCKYDLSKYLSPDMLELYRKQMPTNAFRSEYLGEWITDGGCVFTGFKQCVKDIMKVTDRQIILSIDWSTGQAGDDTVMTVGQLIDNTICIYEIKSFNDKNANETIDYIMAYVDGLVRDGHREIMVIGEKNSIGNVFGDMLRQKLNEYEDSFNDRDWRDQLGLSFNYFNTTNASKERIIKQLCVCFENRLVTIPDNDKLLKELACYEVKVSAAGHLIYNAPAGKHDDYVMSLAFLVNYFYKQIER